MSTQEIKHYAIEYTLNASEGAHLDYVDANLWMELAVKSHPEDISYDGDTIILTDNSELYYN